MTTTLTARDVQRKMYAKAEQSTLDEAAVKKMQLKAFTAEDARKSLGLGKPGACFKIPYFDLHGKPTKFFRVRYVEDMRKGFERITITKEQRYSQPANTNVEAYFAPFFDWATDIAPTAEVPIIITEGELKAACATYHGLPTIGLGGVWSFRSARLTQSLLPSLEEFVWEGRKVFICYDSDAATNPKVVQAENALAKKLTEHGAIVYIARLQQHPDVEGKVGLDDWFLANDCDAERFKTEVLGNASPYAESAMLHKLNQEVLYVSNPGFVYRHEDGFKMPPAAFKEHVYSNWFYDEKRMVGKNEVLVQVAAAPKWLQWPHRAEAKGVTYAPGKPRLTDDMKLNMWTRWGPIDAPEEFQPKPGDVEPWHHLLHHLFGEDDAARVWFERWCAYPVQHPGTKLSTAVALWGTTHGSGKTLVGETLMRLYGRHSAELKDADLEDDRNAWAENISFVLADDITSKLDRKLMRKLMTQITQKWIRLNPKYIPGYSIQDFINYYFTANEPDMLYMDDDDRRFFVWEVLAGKYDFRDYVEWMRSNEGIAAFWHYLLHYDLGDFDPAAPAPVTDGKREMIHLGKSDLGSFVRELKDNGRVLLSKAGMKGDLFTAKELMLLYDRDGSKKVTVNALARELKRAGFRHPATGTNLDCPDGSQVMVYAILNGDKWQDATRADARAHYIENKPKGYWEIIRSKMS